MRIEIKAGYYDGALNANSQFVSMHKLEYNRRMFIVPIGTMIKKTKILGQRNSIIPFIHILIICTAASLPPPLN